MAETVAGWTLLLVWIIAGGMVIRETFIKAKFYKRLDAKLDEVLAREE